MKKSIFLFFVCLLPAVSFGAPAENEMYFRAMQDEMKRTLKELHLPGELKPYYVAYVISETFSKRVQASLGDRIQGNSQMIWEDEPQVDVTSIVSIGNNQNNNTGFFDGEKQLWRGYARAISTKSYEGIRQNLWKTSNTMYLEAIDQYKQKQAFAQQKNIQKKLPDVVPAAQGIYLEEIPAWQPFEEEQMYRWVEKVSAFGKEKKFIDNFYVTAWQQQSNTYYLNSRGAKNQDSKVFYQIKIEAEFRQPDGYEEKEGSTIRLKDFSEEELVRAEQEITSFLDLLQGLYGAPEAEFYLGPVLYKPERAARFIRAVFLDDLSETVAWWNAYSDDDYTASLWRKKLGQRIISPGITIYDRPHEKNYEGIALSGFCRIDWEGVPTEELTLVTDGRLQTLPFSQRPFTSKKHKSNGHALSLNSFGIREGYSNIFVEPEDAWTDEQMEEKLLARCKELKLPYCYILHENGIQRIYTQDGRKEWVVGLAYALNMASTRPLRDILAVGGKRKLVNGNIVIPSILVDEIELEPLDRKPNRKPLIPKPE